MKRVAVWLLVMVTCFGTCELYAAPSKGGAVTYWVCYAIRHKWSWWVILLVAAVGIGFYFEEKKEEKKKKQLENDYDEKGVK